jgi:organic hydroperoxide reductase OsmC/OhrA
MIFCFTIAGTASRGLNMSEYFATICWERGANEPFVDARYSREHRWEFDEGAVVKASASPHIVSAPYSVAANVDPEEAFVASLSSCHMLFFLSIAASRKYLVDAYVDRAIGIMSPNEEGRMAMTRVTLQPEIRFSGSKQPDRAQLEKMHHQAHQQCFIANSVKTEVVTEIVAA